MPFLHKKQVEVNREKKVKLKKYRYQAVKQKEQSKLKRQDYNMK